MKMYSQTDNLTSKSCKCIFCIVVFLNSWVSHLQEYRGLIQQPASEGRKAARIFGARFWALMHIEHVMQGEPGHFLAVGAQANNSSIH
jgi:hypothetical protein